MSARLLHVHLGVETFCLDADEAAEVAALIATDHGAALALARRSHRGTVPPGGILSTPLLMVDAAPPLPQQSTSTGFKPMSTPATMKVASIMLGDARIYGDERLVAEVERLRREVEGQRGVIAALSDAAVKAAPVAPAGPAATATMVDAATLTDGDVMRIAEANRRAADTVYGCHVRGLATAYLVPQAGAKRA